MEIESVKKIYAGYSGVYDALFKRFFHPRIEHALASMDIKAGERILDVGVGTGLSLSHYPRTSRVVGIDLSGKMLGKAQEKVNDNNYNHIRLFEMDAMNLCFADNSFDKVFISHVVSVVPNPYTLMSEVRRVCKPGGEVVIVNHFKSKNKMLAGFERVITPISEKIGWKSDLCMDEFIAKAGLSVKRNFKLKKLDFWSLIFTTNVKDAESERISSC